MIQKLLYAVAVSLVLTAPVFADTARPDLSKVVLSDDDKVATSQLLEWLQARGFDASMVSNVLVYRTKGIPLNLTALQGSGELDRVVFLSYYSPKPEAKGKPEFLELARKLNSSQNFMQVKVDDDGDLTITASLTYVDEISAREFDYFVDLFTAVMSRYILTDDALKMLQ